MDKRFLTIVAAIVIIFIGIFVFTKNSDNGGTAGSSGQASNHIRGQGAKKVTLLEYGDFQCSVCLGYYPTVEKVVAKYDADIYYQFKNLPLSPTPHKNAFAAARAAEAATQQGANKFWDMYHQLYDNQDPSGQTGWAASNDPLNQYFVGFATKIGLNIDQFKTDYASQKVNGIINADTGDFGKTGQQKATPTFFINGTYIPNSDLSDDKGPSLDKFSKAIDDAIAKQ